tara:strand:+ start:338 stop:1054 length:717 start_codon:yes stop_codon:yes gene_type:complete
MSIKDLSSDKVILLSLIGNSLEVTLQHPLNVLKNYKQSSLTNSYKFNCSFKNLYRGYVFNFYNVNTVSLIQYYSYHFLYKYTKNDFFSSLSSGLMGGLLASPSEFYIINKNNESLLQNIKKNKLRNIYKYGLKNCLIREGIYTSCLFTLTPRLENFINKDFSYGNIISPIISGITATFLSHPFDTIKTNQQKNYSNIIKDHQLSFKNSYKGFGCRSFRITTAFIILNETNKFFIKNIF